MNQLKLYEKLRIVWKDTFFFFIYSFRCSQVPIIHGLVVIQGMWSIAPQWLRIPAFVFCCQCILSVFFLKRKNNNNFKNILTVFTFFPKMFLCTYEGLKHSLSHSVEWKSGLNPFFNVGILIFQMDRIALKLNIVCTAKANVRLSLAIFNSGQWREGKSSHSLSLKHSLKITPGCWRQLVKYCRSGVTIIWWARIFLKI